MAPPSPDDVTAPEGAPQASRTRDPFERSLEALSHRERTTAELSEWLVERGYSPAQVDDALSRLIEVGELDDERFARRYAEDKRELRGWGSDRIREALAAKGLPAELVETALAGDSESELARAMALLERRGQRLDDERARNRALAFLARRGYDVDVAYEAVRGYERLAG